MDVLTGDFNGNGQTKKMHHPPVSSKAVILTSVIDAAEERDVAVADLPGAFMQTNIDNKIVHMRIWRKWRSCK